MAQQGSWRVMLPPWCGCGLEYGAQKRMLVPGRTVRWARQQPLRTHSIGIALKCRTIDFHVVTMPETSPRSKKSIAHVPAGMAYLYTKHDASIIAFLPPATTRTLSLSIAPPKTLNRPDPPIAGSLHYMNGVKPLVEPQ